MKKLIAFFMLIAFCAMPTAFGIDAEAVNLKTSDAFEDNQQDLITASSAGRGLSPVEKMYNSRENIQAGNVLRQVGYDNFRPTSGAPALTGKYGDNYKLSIGEKISVLSYGESVDIMAMSGASLITPMTMTEVGSNGTIFVPGIGPVKAEGRSIGEVEAEVNKIARSKYSNLKMKLQIPSGSGFSIFVYGEVNKPGKVFVSSNSSILDALSAAGGVKKTGTLRNIKYNGKYVDLYNSIFLGNDDSIVVKANDKIYVDKIKNTMAIKNGISNPGIYEFKTGETINDIMKYTGDLLVTTQREEVTMVSFDKSKKQKEARNVAWLTAKTTKLENGDSVQFRELYNGVENLVTIQGNIKHPATYAYKEGMRLSDILKSEDELLEETFINQAVIRRISGKDNTIETIPVFLKEFFSGMNDPILMPRDVITIYKSTNSQFVDVFGCINTPKHIPYIPGMTLNDIMTDIKFMESNVPEIKSNEEPEQTEQKIEGEDVKIAVATQNLNNLIPTENVAVEITTPNGSTSIHYLYDIMISSDKTKSIALGPEDKVFFRTLRDNEIMKTVKVSGFVKHPGVFHFVKGQNLVDIIEVAGGLDEDADLRGIVFRRANIHGKQVDLAKKNNDRDIRLLEGRMASGYKQSEQDQNLKLTALEQMRNDEAKIAGRYNGQIALNIKSNDLSKISKIDNVELQDGDDIYIPRVSNYVAVIGEVYSEQSFMYRNGSNVKSYIKLVGGYTPNANRFRVYRVGINGRAEKVRMRTKVTPGDTIVVPRRIAGNDWITPICQTIQSIGYIFIMAFGINKW